MTDFHDNTHGLFIVDPPFGIASFDIGPLIEVHFRHFRQRRQRKPRPAVPGGLLSAAQAAAKLACSIKTLNGHIASGALGYRIIGHGTKRPRRMFTDADLTAFIEAQSRKDVPCPSSPSRARHTSTSISGSEVIAFTARPNARRAVKPKK